MVRIKLALTGDTPYQKLFHSLTIRKAWTQLEAAAASDGLLPQELKEQVRRVLAFGNGCAYCQVKGKPQTSENKKVSYAMAYAEIFLLQREKTEEKFMDVLKEEFTDSEISELIAFICFTTAQQYFGALMDLR
ncbi:carboxymuconolactone decarboxylase family protein [Bacillus massiliglaciei]|uniref:alkylhydroperoxidase n=1 Tax=Bacillus massiliglaciei TaxID=1816693 RepID=UPI000AB58D40|nr:alkylhydroperoxidase [Bacillus massiliglaciei]